MVRGRVEEGRNIERKTHRGWKGRHHVEGRERGAKGWRKRRQKWDRRVGPKGPIGKDMDLGIRLRAAIQREHRWAVEAGRSGPLYRCTCGTRLEEGGESGARSGVARYWGGGWA